MTNKFLTPKPLLSALILIAGIGFMVSCRKQDVTAAPDSQHLHSVTSLSTNLLGTVSLGALQVFTLAGNGTPGLVNAQGAAARFNNPSATAVDAAGNVYIADKSNHVIRKMTSSGVVTTLAGSGVAGYLDATGSTAQFNNPSGVAVDAAGNVYVADAGNHVIRKMTASGVVTTLAGIFNFPGFANGPGNTAQFNNPVGVALDASGNVLVADAGNHMIRRITPAGFVSLVAGTGTPGSADGVGSFSQFNNPSGVAVDAAGNVYVADAGNNKIRKIEGFNVSTLAGSGTAGYTEGTGNAAQFNNPTGVAVDASGNVWVADKSNHAIRQVTASGAVSTLTGNGTATFVDGAVSVARFSSPAGIAINVSGNLFIADQTNQRIRRIAPRTVIVSTLAGNGVAGRVNGIGTAAQFFYPVGLYADANALLVAERGNNDVRSISFSNSEVSTLVGAQGVAGYQNGFFLGAAFNAPVGVTWVPSTSALFISDMNNHSIREKLGFYVYGYAGSTTPGFADGQYSNARFTYPAGITSDASGNLYVADFSNNSIRKISPSGFVSTLAGRSAGFADGRADSVARFNGPYGIAVDATGNVYVTDFFNNRIRKISPAGLVSTLAGNGVQGLVNGTAASAQFNHPVGVAVDASGNVYVAEADNHVVRMITPSGVVSTLAGTGVSGYQDGSGDVAMFNSPFGIAVDPSGNIYVSDYNDNRIRKISIQ